MKLRMLVALPLLLLAVAVSTFVPGTAGAATRDRALRFTGTIADSFSRVRRGMQWNSRSRGPDDLYDSH